MLKILILGSEGFIGTNLVQYYRKKGYDVYGCGLRKPAFTAYHYFQVQRTPEDLEDIFTKTDFNFCINASGSGKVGFSVNYPVADFECNVRDTVYILDTIRKYNPECKYLHISSAAVYGNPEHMPVRENAATAPLSPYGWHKLMAEQLCKEYNILYGLSVAIARPFSIYGPGLKKQLFWDIFQNYIRDPAAVELWGTGNESRDFVYIDDVIQCLDLILDKATMQGEVYNIASGDETKIKDVVQQLFEFMPGVPQVVFNTKIKEGDPLNWQADISKIKELGFFPQVSLRSGIYKMAEWLMSIHKVS